MDQGNESYERDYAALKEKLRRYPGITLVSVDKEVPEQYVIEYKLFGYGYDPSGQIQMLRRHEVQISLPFGYPHFPPTVKPLTRICHPDVAEHAIRIAGYWQENPSLADLVIHIGDMIRGAVYSTEAPFNDEAAKWYAANGHKLPLAELEYVDPDAEARVADTRSPFPFKLVAGAVLALLVLAGGGLAVRDKMVIGGSAEQLARIHEEVKRRNFTEAESIGNGLAASLEWGLFFSGERQNLLAEVQTVLNSETMRQGLLGKVQYNGEFLPIPVADTLEKTRQMTEVAVARLAGGELDSAVSMFDSAIKLAESSGQVEAADGVRRVSAEKRLAYYVERANRAYGDEEWQQAMELYGQAVRLLEGERRFLSQDALATRDKVIKLEALAQASVSREKAALAERQKDYGAAASHYRDILQVIGQNEFGADPVLARVGSDAEAEYQRLAELDQVARGSQYLIDNFKEIFMAHYPGLYEPGLQSPRVRYLGRSDGRLVFLMSCIELVKRQTNEFRLSYQLDPVTGGWSIYQDGK